ncbi:Acg family FMN-binding oxidoreductase [Marinobacter zhejiangensis]|uniref:Nitroreductase family protein n=1 Tax=Marinobacter zhejiangensis TaxID=488535 RepID=A0A1I4T3E6_9GAMM|nr:nitroreductase family protein [Marinobacter zhejiangensis]SFM71171.1 Nitroreductase family protein [Marinobacter zhejiangensis]
MSNNAWCNRAESIIEMAALAPSSHNTQPWVFRVSPSGIDLYADRTRALPVNDPFDRELTISCGCALMNLRAAAEGEGLGVRVDCFPCPEDPDLLARVAFTGELDPGVERSELSDVITRRRTCRRRFDPRNLTDQVVGQLQAVAQSEGAGLVPLLAESDRLQAAELVAAGDTAQWRDPRWRRELAAWMHPRRQGDGLTVPSLAAPVAQLVVRTFDMGGGVAAKDRDLAEASPLLAVLTTDSDGPLDWLRAGQALQRTLLVACQLGLQASYLNQPIQVESLRPKLQSLIGGGFPQILLRLGYPDKDIEPAPRRPLGEIIEREFER